MSRLSMAAIWLERAIFFSIFVMGFVSPKAFYFAFVALFLTICIHIAFDKAYRQEWSRYLDKLFD